MTEISGQSDPDTIVYYFWVISDWAYLGGERLEALAGKHKVAIDYRPMDMPAVYSRTGGILLGQRSQQRQDYRIAEMYRWRDRLGIPLTIEPKYFPTEHTLASLLVVAAKLAGVPPGPMTNAIMRALWAEEKNIADEAELAEICAPHVPDVGALLAAANTDAVKAEYQSYTDRAPADGVFGSPFYLYMGEIFWGQDRLDFLADAVARQKGAA